MYLVDAIVCLFSLVVRPADCVSGGSGLRSRTCSVRITGFRFQLLVLWSRNRGLA